MWKTFVNQAACTCQGNSRHAHTWSWEQAYSRNCKTIMSLVPMPTNCFLTPRLIESFWATV